VIALTHFDLNHFAICPDTKYPSVVLEFEALIFACPPSQACGRLRRGGRGICLLFGACYLKFACHLVLDGCDLPLWMLGHD